MKWGFQGSKALFLILFCHFDEKNSKKLILSYSKRSICFYQCTAFINVSGTRTTVSVTNLFEKAEYKKPIFQGLISRVLLDIETRNQVFCIDLRPVTIYISIGKIVLLYLFYNAG